MDRNVLTKEREKVEKYMDLTIELQTTSVGYYY